MTTENPCWGCWWEEGGRCYEGEPERLPDGRSTVLAEATCDKRKSKRKVMDRAFKSGRLMGAVAESYAAQQVPQMERLLGRKLEEPK